jgi:hypothetical protein
MLNFQALSRCEPSSSNGRNEGGEVIMPWDEQAEDNPLPRLLYLLPVAATSLSQQSTADMTLQRAVGEVSRPTAVFSNGDLPAPS